ncbi:MAG: CRISPR-associated endonuclease Cas2 [Kiritimatiellia bacterium]
MMVLVSYDVSTREKKGRTRLRKAAKACLDYGQRVQNSVFECDLDPAQWAVLKDRLEKIIKEEEDSLRFYYLGKNWQRKVEHIGTKGIGDLRNDPLVV